MPTDMFCPGEYLWWEALEYENANLQTAQAVRAMLEYIRAMRDAA